MSLVARHAPTSPAPGPVLVHGFGPMGSAALEDAPADIVADADVMLPRNAVTGAEYKGGNIMRLVSAEVANGYGTGGWAGFKQWLSVGRVVRKDEHGTACITVIGNNGAESETARSVTDSCETGADGKKKGRGVRGFRVFHFDQTCALGEVSTPAVDPGEDMADRWSESH